MPDAIDCGEFGSLVINGKFSNRRESLLDMQTFFECTPAYGRH